MKTLLTSLFAVWLAAVTPARGALDFTLHQKTSVADAIQVDEVFITDGPSKIFLRIPSGWQVSNNAQSLNFVPDAAGAQVRVESYPGSKALNIDQAGGRELLQQVTTQIPGDAKNVVALPVELNPLPLFGWHTLEVALRYEFSNQPLRRSVMYLNMIPGRVVQMTVIAPEASFDKIHKQARQLLSSWFEPSRDLPPDLQHQYDNPKMGN